MDRLTSMDVFAKVVAGGSFSGAARQARLSPAVVSKHIQALESWLGVRLLNGSTRRIALTEAGEAFHARCTRILAEINDATGAAGELQKTARGKLRVISPGFFGARQVTPAIVDYMAGNPDVTVVLDLNDRYVDVLGEGYDLAIIVGHLPDSTLTARRLTPVRFVTCASPDYLARRGVPEHPEELRHHDCLQYTGLGEWRFVAPDGAPIAIQVPAQFASATSALRTAALLGAGVMQCPTYVVGEDLEAGRLVPILTEYLVPEFSAYAVHAQGQYVPAKLRGLLIFLRPGSDRTRPGIAGGGGPSNRPNRYHSGIMHDLGIQFLLIAAFSFPPLPLTCLLQTSIAGSSVFRRSGDVRRSYGGRE
jgi:DNA-binding transcriptional LysR family regulator